MMRSFAAFFCFAGCLSFHPTVFAAQEWQQPTAEELSLTVVPAVPGAAAIILYREERYDDSHQSTEIYIREKILTEAAKKDADVEIPYEHRIFTVTFVAGRTIHKDGTIVAFTGKPFDKLIVKGSGAQYHAKVFAMPDVQVGSILEYRYTILYDDQYTIPPSWILQGEYFIRKENFRYVQADLHGGFVKNSAGHLAHGISYVTILPFGIAAPHYVEVPGRDTHDSLMNYYELDATNIKPVTKEEYQPPLEGLSYRVLFYNRFFETPDKFWEAEGKDWSKQANHFMGPGSAITQAVGQLVAVGDTPEQKLRKIYTAVMTVENTDFTRKHSVDEDKASGDKPTKTADDVWKRKRGNSDQIAMLFVAMARTAGMQSYLMAVTNRDTHIFQKNLPSTGQLDDDIAIVQLDGKDHFFDPGSRYCTYGQLNWKHSEAGGLRQTANATELSTSSPMNYKDSIEESAARLQMDKTGNATGVLQVTYTGAAALGWRQAILKGDMTEEMKNMEDTMKRKMPAGMNVKITALTETANSDKPMIARFEVSGPIGTGTTKRMFVVGNLFQSAAKPSFVSPIRENAVYFSYPYIEVDDVQITPATGAAVESMPTSKKELLNKAAYYRIESGMKGNAASIIRELAIGAQALPVSDYQELRTFYSKVDTSDQEQLVFKSEMSPLAK